MRLNSSRRHTGTLLSARCVGISRSRRIQAVKTRNAKIRRSECRWVGKPAVRMPDKGRCTSVGFDVLAWRGHRQTMPHSAMIEILVGGIAHRRGWAGLSFRGTDALSFAHSPRGQQLHGGLDRGGQARASGLRPTHGSLERPRAAARYKTVRIAARQSYSAARILPLTSACPQARVGPRRVSAFGELLQPFQVQNAWF